MTSDASITADSLWGIRSFSWNFEDDALVDVVRSNPVVSHSFEAQGRQAVPEPLASFETDASSLKQSMPHERIFIKTEYESSQVKNEHTKDIPSSALARGSGTQDGRGQEIRQCTACTDSFPSRDVVNSPCNHPYCADCIATLFEEATKHESRFPPKCCSQPIPLVLVKPYLTPASILLFERKTVEFATLNRTYCSKEDCNAFIEPTYVKDSTATCQDCYQQTCTTCKRKGHEGDCPEDRDIQILVKTAAEKGWQRCFKCRRIVERLSGCNHMT